jgi:ABC-type transport system involved in multi-copper enzyme maturation permease subunit
MARGLHFPPTKLNSIPGMLGAYIKKELLHHLASFPFWVATLLSVALAAASTLVAAHDYELRWNRYRDGVEADRKELATVTVYSFLQPVVLRPPEPLSVFDQGFDARLGTDVRIHLFQIPAAATGGFQGNEFMAPLPAAGVDLTTIVTVVLGLLALLLASDAVIGEREEGTLRTALAHGAARGKLLAGKILGGLLAVSIPLAAVLLVSSAVLGVTVGLAPYRDRGARVAGLLASYVAYLGLMFLLGLLVSLRARSTARALLSAVLLWLVVVVLLPAIAWALAGVLVDAQAANGLAQPGSRELLEKEKRWLAAATPHPLGRRVNGHTAISTVDGPNQAIRYRNGSALYYDALREHYRSEVASGIQQAERLYQIRRRHEERLRQGERLGLAFAIASPAHLLYRLSEIFSGTSLDDYDGFLAACRRHRRELQAFFDRRGAWRSWRWFTDDPPERLYPWPRFLGLRPEDVDESMAQSLLKRLSSAEVAPELVRHGQEVDADGARRLNPDELPPFTYRTPGFAERLRRAAPAGFSLAVLIALATAAAWQQFLRYDPR